MISKINYLTNFGSYRQFQWGATAPFARRNLIYGWNYSGKTTLSRLFQIVTEPDLLARWPGSQFEVELQDGTKLNHASLQNPPQLKVFNRDFIERNFEQEHRAPSFFVVGADTINLRNRITRLNEHETRIKAIRKERSVSLRRLQSELDTLRTNHARWVAELTGDKTYNRTKLGADIDKVKESPQEYILTDGDLEAKVTLVRSIDQWGHVDMVCAPAENPATLLYSLHAVLQKTATNEAIAKLKDNRDLESWIRTGLSHHVGSSQCEFCGSAILEERLAALKGHFSAAYEDLTAEVAAIVAKLRTANVTINLPDQRDFIPDLRLEFADLKTEVENWVSWATSVVGELATIAEKKQLSLETQLTCTVDTSRASEIDRIVEDINALVVAHERKRSQIDAERRLAKEVIEKHQAAIYYRDNDVPGKETEIQRAQNMVEKAEHLLSAIKYERDEVNAQISRHSVAVSKLDETLKFLLPDNNVSVVEVDGGRFEFRRNETPATNLSDGERTAIAFAYFLATLESNGASLDQTIVFIDDPISSLDSNHIYAVFALLTKKLEPCMQLFVATHNSELYTLLKEKWFVTQEDYANNKRAHSYHIRRYLDADDKVWQSSIADTPALLRKYKSEYQFVFDQLHSFASAEEPSLHEAYTSPNLLRKFLEAYLGFVKPCVSRWSDKLDLLFESQVDQVEIQKFADDASHLQGLSRALEQPYFVTNAQNIVKKVMRALKAKDLPHYTSMCTVIGVEP
ncbi:MAG TPA: hypothetical protein DIS79_06930 [Bacteroidetes bacterium]|nr:hypothetical protein [Bacteroidota bacterium]HRK05441.1 AAA family ATPase [Chlorobiota bacterium]